MLILMVVVLAESAHGDDGPEAVVNLSAQGIANEEREWREEKEDAMGKQETYRQEKLEIERERVRAARFGEQMRAAEIFRREDISLSWAEAFKMAGDMMKAMNS